VVSLVPKLPRPCEYSGDECLRWCPSSRFGTPLPEALLPSRPAPRRNAGEFHRHCPPAVRMWRGLRGRTGLASGSRASGQDVPKRSFATRVKAGGCRSDR
jgi:hypothetical protein